MSCWTPLSIPQAGQQKSRGVLPEPTMPKAKAAMLKRSEAFSLAPFCKFARQFMDFGRLRYVDMPKIQSYLKQPKTIPQVGHRMDAPGGAELFKNASVSFPFRPFQKIIERTEHFVAAHAGIFSVRIKVMPCILLDHFFKTLAGSGLDV